MKAKKFDRDFDAGKSVAASLDLAKARRPMQEQRRVNVDFPNWMIEGLDRVLCQRTTLYELLNTANSSTRVH